MSERAGNTYAIGLDKNAPNFVQVTPIASIGPTLR